SVTLFQLRIEGSRGQRSLAQSTNPHQAERLTRHGVNGVGRAIVMFGDDHRSKCEGLRGSPSALRIDKSMRYVPLGTVRCLPPGRLVVVPSHTNAKKELVALL